MKLFFSENPNSGFAGVEDHVPNLYTAGLEDVI
jgi:hypothetical protein